MNLRESMNNFISNQIDLLRSNAEDVSLEDNGSFKFVLTAIGFCFIAWNWITNYLSNNLFSYETLVFFNLSKNLFLIILILLFIFVLIRAYALVLEELNKKICYYISTKLYVGIFYSFIYTIIISIYFYIALVYMTKSNFEDVVLKIVIGYFILSVLIAASLGVISFKYKWNFLIPIVLISFIVFSVTFLDDMADRPSVIDFDIKNIYKNDISLIPVPVEVTGLNYDLWVGIFKENESNHLNLLEEKKFPSKTDDKIVEHSTKQYLSGNYLNNGKYLVYINTTELETGYYEIWLNVANTNKITSSGFRLINDST